MKEVMMQLPEVNDYRITEAYNQLKTNIAFCGNNIKVIAVTSSVPNEGKSSVAFTLSRLLAENGKKVLLVDCDLRKSVLAGKYHMDGVEKGLSHYLSGQADRKEVIYSTKEEGFFLTVAGPLSPDPTALLDSEQFKVFIEDARKEFDYVILDAPPLGLVIDAVIVGKFSDGAIVVIEQGIISRKMLQGVIKQLKKGEIRILGAVLNKVDERIGVYGNYEYKYGYGYYGGEDSEKPSKKRRSKRRIHNGI